MKFIFKNITDDCIVNILLGKSEIKLLGFYKNTKLGKWGSSLGVGLESNFKHPKLPNLNYTYYSQNYTTELSAVKEIFYFPGSI